MSTFRSATAQAPIPPPVILYSIRAPRWVHLVSMLPTIAVTSAIAYFVFVREPVSDGFGSTTEIGGDFKLIFGGFVLLGIFLTGVFAYRFVKRPSGFMMTEEGFEYSPGGVSTGLIRWGDVIELKEESVLTSGSGIAPRRESALAVVLSNPEEYLARFPAALRPLLALRAQTNSSPLLLNPRDLGRDYGVVIGMMREQVNRHTATRS
jgi:hypothetical protein